MNKRELKTPNLARRSWHHLSVPYEVKFTPDNAAFYFHNRQKKADDNAGTQTADERRGGSTSTSQSDAHSPSQDEDPSLEASGQSATSSAVSCLPHLLTVLLLFQTMLTRTKMLKVEKILTRAKMLTRMKMKLSYREMSTEAPPLVLPG